MSRYTVLAGLVASIAGSLIYGQQEPNIPPAKNEPLQVKFLSAVSKNERTLLIFEVINTSELPIGYNGSDPKDSEVFPGLKALAPHLEVRVHDVATGMSRDLNRQTLDHNVTLRAKQKGKFEVPLPPGAWDELSVGIRWFEMSAEASRSGIAWRPAVSRKATNPGPVDFSFIQPPAPSKKTMQDFPIAVGGWSEPVKALRGRLMILQRQRPDGKMRDTSVYLDLHHSAETVGEPLHIRVDPKQRIELYDAASKAVPGGILNSDGHPEPVLVTLPYDCTMRVRVSAYNIGAEDGLVITLLSNLWKLPSGTEGEYYQTG